MSGSRYRISDQYAAYFITCTIVDWVDIFTRKECKDIIVDSLQYCVNHKGLAIHAWCLMSNHIHLVCRATGSHTLSEIIRDFKKWTARELIEWVKNPLESRRDWIEYRFHYNACFLKGVENYHVWSSDNHPVLLDYEEIFWQKIHYTHMNPVLAGVVEYPDEYLHSSARDYSGRKGLVEVVIP